MVRFLAPLLALLLLAALPVRAATGLDGARAGSQGARQKLSEIRSRQMAMRMELNGVAGQIEALKSQGKRGAELDEALRRSQALSGSLAEAAQELSRAEADAEREHLTLMTALGTELERVQAQAERSQNREERARLIAQLRALRAERDQVRALLPAAKLPPLTASGSDDPADLMEQADLLRDSEDKLREKLKALETRVAELRAERELDRRMNDFLGDQAMFDDHDRRLRRTTQRELTRGTHPPLAGAPASSDAAASGPEAGTNMGSGDPFNEPPSNESAGPITRDNSTGSGGGSTGLTSQGNITQIARGADSRPQLGSVDARMLQGATARDIETLEAELKKLRKLADDLNQRANQLEQRAKE